MMERLSLLKRFEEKYCPEPNTGCWLWTAALNNKGYGKIGAYRSKGRYDWMLAHRASWFLFKGQLSDEMCVLHKCDTPACVNPDHLFLGTKGDNIRDAVHKGRDKPHNRAKTHCKRGHAFTVENTYNYVFAGKAHRACKTCSSIEGGRRRREACGKA